jgi:lysine/ornithine N-monooxygenase
MTREEEREEEREEIARLAREAGFNVSENASFADAIFISMLYRFAHLIAAAEREACAQVCSDIANQPSNVILGVAITCAAAIRARGEE